MRNIIQSKNTKLWYGMSLIVWCQLTRVVPVWQCLLNICCCFSLIVYVFSCVCCCGSYSEFTDNAAGEYRAGDGVP